MHHVVSINDKSGLSQSLKRGRWNGDRKLVHTTRIPHTILNVH